MAIIDDVQSVNPQPCEDAISREHTLTEFKRLYFDDKTVIRCAELVLKNELPVTPQPKTGYWIDNHNNTISCDRCHTWFNKDDRYGYMHYCPFCNAKMVEPQERSEE